MNNPDVRASWIWCRGEERPKNFYLYVRKSFELDAPVRSASVRLTADSRYRLFVNGEATAHGPARCDPRWQCLDEWDITQKLRPGPNTLAALVHHYGEWTFSYILGRGGFLAEIIVRLENGRSVIFGSDATWKVRPADAWERQLPRMSIQLGYPEVYDARKEVQGWTETGFDDSRWETATVLGPPGTAPWAHLVPREIPAMSEVPVSPESVIRMGEVGTAALGYSVEILRVVWSTSHAVGYLASFVWSPFAMKTEIHAGSQDAMRLWLNGREVISSCVVRDAAPDQEVVRVPLRKGWNPVLAKIVQGEGQWHFIFRFEGAGSETLVFSDSPETDPAEADQARPWRIAAPFPSPGVEEGFRKAYGPESEIDFLRTYEGKNGRVIGWQTAGVTRESNLTSIVMGRERRLPGDSRGIDRRDGLIFPGRPAIFFPSKVEGRYAVLDFGREVTGYPVIEITGAEGGEVVDMGYSEVLETSEGEAVRPDEQERGVVNPDRGGVHNADRYVCKAGDQRFRTFDKRAFRYMQVDVRNLGRPLAVGPVSVVLSTYPVEHRGSFCCSDPLLNRIWEVGRWTARLNMEDAYSDSPWRERAQWWGDVRVEAFIAYYAFGDAKLVRQGLRHIAESQTEDGLTMGVYPTSWEGGVLPTYTLLWVISLWDYYMYTGDRGTVTELFPNVERAMDYFSRFTGEHNLLRDVPGWLFVDWAPVATDGESAAVNALYCGALHAAGEVAGVLGRAGKRRDYGLLAERVRSGMRQRLWYKERHCYRDNWKDGVPGVRVSEQANCWAVVFGAVHRDNASAILDSVLSENGAEVRVATPYFSWYLLQAFAAAGRHPQALEYVRNKWGAMLAWGATSWWETWEPKASFCHGWSAGPTAFLQSDILGARPGRPGWEEILVEPNPAGLDWARGEVPTPRGKLSVEFSAAEGFSLEVSTPALTTIVLPAGQGDRISVTDESGAAPAGFKIHPASGGKARVVLREAGLYHIVVYSQLRGKG